ncbi:glycosyltransferase family 9 protein [Candidatus Pacearchaeota archaeon]|nr:glycosyltransferase family 9 protein [Candidatus Pacearchaeota archaeon]
MTIKICIIKLGALGDVVRTTPLLLGIKEKYPESEITWITKSNAKEILEDNELVDNLLFIPCKTAENFDIIYNLDIEQEATKLALEINAEKKYGFYDNEGFPTAFNEGAEYYLNTVFDDEIKKSNRKTYQQMMFDIMEITYKQQEPFISVHKKNKEEMNEFLRKNSLVDKKIIGFNIGASKTWPSKAWSKQKIIEFIPRAKEKGYEVLLLGGEDEAQVMDEIYNFNIGKEIKIYKRNTANSLKDFFATIFFCHVIICGDTLALHVATALKKQVIALFFCNSPDEIESYGRVKKLVSPILYDFFPEKSDEYSEVLVNSISVEEVLKALDEIKQQA